MHTIELIEKSSGIPFSYNTVTSYDIKADPMVLHIQVDVGIDQEGEPQYVDVVREFAKAEFTAEVLE